MSPRSVFRRMFRALDDDHFDRTALRIELQSELLLQGGGERRTVRIDRGRRGGPWRQTTGRELWHLIRRPREIDVVTPREAGPIDNVSIDESRQNARELRNVDAAP